MFFGDAAQLDEQFYSVYSILDFEIIKCVCLPNELVHCSDAA